MATAEWPDGISATAAVFWGAHAPRVQISAPPPKSQRAFAEASFSQNTYSPALLHRVAKKSILLLGSPLVPAIGEAPIAAREARALPRQRDPQQRRDDASAGDKRATQGA